MYTTPPVITFGALKNPRLCVLYSGGVSDGKYRVYPGDEVGDEFGI